MTDLGRRSLAEDYDVPLLINGAWQLAGDHGGRPDDERTLLQRLSRLVDAGFDTFDCADIYGGVETLLGRLLAASGRRVRIHTKCVPDRELLPRLHRDDVVRTIDRSLRRLGVERLELVQLHWWDYEVPGYVDAALWLADLQRAGKIRLLGATNFDVPRLREIVEAGVGLVSHQVQYSALDRRPENGMADYCARHGIRLLCYGVLAGGFLDGRWLDQPAPKPPLPNRSLTKYRLIVDEYGGWERYQALLQELQRIAAKHACSVAGVATRYVLDRPQVAAAILGATGDRHLDDNLRALELRLDEDDERTLDELRDADRGPRGDVYTLERDAGGPHAALMKYNLNRAASR